MIIIIINSEQRARSIFHDQKSQDGRGKMAAQESVVLEGVFLPS